MKLSKGLTVWWVHLNSLEIKEVVIKEKFNGISPTHYLTECREIVDPNFCYDDKNKALAMLGKVKLMKKMLQDQGIDIK